MLFTAAGQGSSNYEYQFWLKDSTGWTVTQNYGAASTWTLPPTTPAGTYQVAVWVRTSALVVGFDAWTFVDYTLGVPPATGVTLTPSLTSPQPAGTVVTFTAAGQGSSNYQYQFWLKDSTGWTVTQSYGAASAWTLPAATPPGDYQVAVWVRTTSAVSMDAWTFVNYTVVAPPATGVTLTPSLASPQPAGTAVTFTAAGQGSSGYQYEFWLKDSTGWTVTQAYGGGSTWTLPASTPAGAYQVAVWVRTSPLVGMDTWTFVDYVIQ